MSKKTRSIILAIIVILGIAGAWYVWSNYGSKPDSSQAPAVGRKVSGQILLDGTVVPEKTADLGFVVAANITSIPVKVGDTVKMGEVLATQDSSDLQAGADAAQASVSSAQDMLNNLKHILKLQQLKLSGLSGNARKQQDAQVASQKNSIEAQTDAITAAQDNVTNAQVQVDKTILKAPFDGIITRQDGQVGEVAGVYSAPFMTIASNEAPQEIYAYASDLDMSSIKVGQSAQAVFDLPGAEKTMSASVTAIDPSTNSSQDKSSYRITLLLNNSDPDVKIGMHASISF